jgi:nucleotide-binding universal stress UspA family protein
MSIVTKILCPVDFSETARHALHYALQMARTFGAELKVVHVIEAAPLYQAYDGMPDVGLPQAVEQAARRSMERLLGSLDSSGVRVSHEVLDGPTYRTIVAQAEAWGADLIVMGTHGRSKLELAFFGSVAERVVKSASCPVLVVRKPKNA